MGGALDIAGEERNEAKYRIAEDLNMKRILNISLLVLIAAGAVICQNEYVSGEKIEVGHYREIEVLRLSGSKTVQLRPGQEYQFHVLSTVFGRHGMFREVVAPATWKVSKAAKVKIDKTGRVAVGVKAKHGRRFVVTATVIAKDPWEPKAYPRTVEQDVVVFDPKENPLVGDWTQKAITTCEGQKIDVEGDDGLRMLEFRADGTYAAAVAPFEAYRDYWGTYKFDPKAGTLKMTADGGNKDRSQLVTEGRYEVKDGALTILGMQLLPDPPSPKPCKAHFSK
jgi:hypothetical protein